MERKKVVKEEKENVRIKPRWKKTGKGTLRLFGRIIKPNETFQAYPEEIPDSFKDCLRCLDEEALKEDIERVEEEVEITPVYDIIAVEGKPHFFDVINTVSGKAINEAPLKKKEALSLKETLEA